MKQLRNFILPGLAILLAGCSGPDQKTPPSGGAPVGTSSGSTEVKPPSDAKKLKIGYVLHGSNAFTEQIKHGAQDAGKALGVEVEILAPADFKANEAITIFEGMAQKKVDGIVCIPMPGEQWVKPIKEVMGANIPVLTANITSDGSGSPTWVGQDEYQSGVILAEQLKKQLAAAKVTTGKISVGICAPGVKVLTDRYDGFKKGMAGSGFTVGEAVDVKTGATDNYSAWESMASGNPNTVAIVGLCSMDVPNLYKLKDKTKAKWLVAGYDLVQEGLDSLKKGITQVILGQHPYLQGYLPVRALVENLRDKKALPKGWLPIATEIITKDNVNSVYDRETKRDAETKWYADFIAKNYVDLGALAKPMPGTPAVK